MLIHELKAIFVHVPKTAGQSIEQGFLSYLGESWNTRHKYLLCRNQDPACGPPRLAHLTAPEYRTLGYVSAEQFPRYFKFGFVRNPWARLASEYRFRYSRIKMPFKRWLLENFPQPGWDDAWRHVMPQSNYLYETDGRLAVDFVGRFESLRDDYLKVVNELSIGLPALPRANATVDLAYVELLRELGAVRGVRDIVSTKLRQILMQTPACWQDYYDECTRAFVARFYAEDIERFGYSFER